MKNQWFSGSPLPLNEWFGKHPLEPMEWQWFFSRATIGTNGMAMVFNGLQQLVKRWDGNNPSLRSQMEWFIFTEELPQCIWQKELQPTPPPAKEIFFNM